MAKTRETVQMTERDISEPMGLARLTVIKADTLVEQAYDAVRKAIMSGEFAPGAPLSIRTLARTMGTSAMPIRDAMQRLAAEGALRLAPTRVYQIPTLARADFEDVWTLRQMIEPMAAARAAREAKPEEMRATEAHLEELEQALRAKSPQAILERNRLFHFEIYQATHSTQILNVIEILWLRSGPLLHLLLDKAIPERDAWLQQIEHHRRLAHAISKRNGGAARRATRLILVDSANWYREHCNFEG